MRKIERKAEVKTYLAKRRYSNEYIECIRLGSCGDNFGSVMEIETGEEFTTYGYNFLRETGNTILKTITYQDKV